MHDRLAMSLQDDLTDQIVRHSASESSSTSPPSKWSTPFIGRMLSNIANMARLDAHHCRRDAPLRGHHPRRTGHANARHTYRSRRGRNASVERALHGGGSAGCRFQSSQSINVLSSEDVVLVRQAIRRLHCSWGLASSTRPRLSPLPVNWPGTCSFMAEALSWSM